MLTKEAIIKVLYENSDNLLVSDSPMICVDADNYNTVAEQILLLIQQPS